MLSYWGAIPLGIFLAHSYRVDQMEVIYAADFYLRPVGFFHVERLRAALFLAQHVPFFLANAPR